MCELRSIAYFVIPGLFHFVISVNAQNDDISGSMIISDLVEELAASEIENSDIEEISEDLSHLLDYPLNLNLAGEEELKHLHILNDFQVYTLLEYIRIYGPILSLGELQTIIGFSIDVIKKIEPFVSVSPLPEQANPKIRKTQQEFMFKYVTNTGKKKNPYDTLASITDYPGKNRSMTCRYQIKSGSFWRAGFLFDQDAGETFILPDKPFKPDFTSAYLEMNRKGFVNHLIIGDFRTSYGQGLILSNFSQRKGSTVLRKPERTGIRKYSSTGENDFFRGAALKMKHRNLTMEIFGSGLYQDATLYFDTCSYIKSLISGGLHRTEAELRKKDAVLIRSFGSHASLKTRILDLSITCFSQNFNTDYLIKTSPFVSCRVKNGDAIRNISTDYKLNLNKIILFGELASDFKGRMAVIMELLAELHPLVHYSFLYRWYHPSYLGLKASGFGEKSNTRNEEGYYMGIEMYPWKYLKIDIFADMYNFPFIDISTVSPLSGSEYFLNCCFFTDHKSELNYRLRYEKKQENIDRQGSGINLTDANCKISNRFELKFSVLQDLILKSRTEFNYFKKPGSGWSKGYYCGNDLAYEHKKTGCKFWIRYAVFDIPGWDNRIYAFENDVLYSFSTPVYNSTGSKIIFLTKVCLSEKFEFWFRYSSSSFYGLKITGSGNDLALKNKSPYLSFQLRVKV